MKLWDAADRFARTIDHNGRVLVFTARTRPDSSGSRIGYAVLQPSTENPDRDAVWTDYAYLPFPRELRTVGRSVITVRLGEVELPAAEVPFDVVSDDRHVYVFRQSTDATLYVDRFVFDELTNRLVATWEVRFRRSRKQDIPLDRRDTFGTTDMNDSRFVEPTLELDFVRNLTGGRFCVQILPTELVGVERWQIFAEDASDQRLNSYSILRSFDGLFDLSDCLAGDGTVAPNRRYQLRDLAGNALVLQSGPGAVAYHVQEWQEDVYGQTALQKRELRLMLAVSAGPAAHLAVIDFGVGKDGFVAQTPDEVVVASAPAIGTGLSFVRAAGTSVQLPDLGTGAEITIEAWIHPAEHPAGPAYLVQSSESVGAVFALYLDSGVPTFETDAGLVAGDMALSSYEWSHLAGVSTASGPLLYVNGQRHQQPSRPVDPVRGAPRRTGSSPTDGYLLGGADGVTGVLDDVRLWQVARTGEELLATMYQALTPATPGWSDLAGYWKLDEPVDDARATTVANSSARGAAADGVLDGPAWSRDAAPIGFSMVPSAWDPNGLTVAGESLAGWATTGAPVLSEGADSAVHLYFSDQAGQWATAAHYSVIWTRASFLTAWSAVDPDRPDNDEAGLLRWVARQAGAPMSGPGEAPDRVAIEPDLVDSASATVTLTSYTGYRERWPSVPLALPGFADVINGEAVQTTSDPAELARDVVMYDYTAVEVTEAGGEQGPPPAPGQGSLIFRVLPDSLPTNGCIGLATTTDVASATRGRAGADGRWQASPPLVALDMSQGDQFVRVLSTTQVGNYTGPLRLDRDLAVEAWVKPASFDPSSATTLLVFNQPGHAQYLLGLTGAGAPFAGSGEVWAGAEASLPAGEWTHLAASYRTDFGLQLGGERYLDAGNSRSLDLSEAIAVEAWVRPDRLGARACVAAKWDPAGGKSWELAIDAAGRLEFTVNQATATGTMSRTERSATVLTAEEWHHVAGVYDVAFDREVAIMFQTGSYVAIPQPSRVPTTGISVAMWVKTTVPLPATGVQTLFASVDPDSPLPILLTVTDKTVEFRVWADGVEHRVRSSRELRSEDWVHLAASYTAGGDSLLTMDGVAVGQPVPSTAEHPAATGFWPDRDGVIAAAPAAFTVGGYPSQDRSFIGSINEVSLWDRGLSLDAIRQKIKRPLAATEVGIVGYWRFNDLFGITVMDLVGTANGTLSGGNFVRVDKGAFAHKVFVDGQLEAFGRVTDPLVLSDAGLTLGSGHFAAYLQGALAESRLWKVGRMNWQIDYFAARDVEPNAEGLVALWTMETGRGYVAFDSKSDNNAVIRDGQLDLTEETVDAMWIRTSFKAAWTFFVNGAAAVSTVRTPDQAGYGDPQATIAALRVQGAVGRVFAGELNELRVWDRQLSGDQVRTSMHSALSGAEAGLAGYWPMADGSGTVVSDRSGYGANGQWIGPDDVVWRLSEAPLGWEIPALRSVPLGNVVPQNRQCSSGPGVARYGQQFTWPRGGSVAAYLQAYALIPLDQTLELFSGFKVGDLDLQYVGQAQLAPALIGYIEGPPPLPAENLKVYPNTPNSYVGASTLTLDETNGETFSYTASRSVGTDISVATKLGLMLSSETSAGIGVQTRVQAVTFTLGGVIRVDETQSDDDSASLTEDHQVIARKYIEAFGHWVSNTYQIDGGVGDLLYPNNYGYAQVRSGTADLFAMRLRGRGGIVGYSVRPNPDVPEDVNVIMFKLKPTYVKNGTLDGWIGFEPDADYRQLQPGEHGSYFKPLEAYALKQQIDREQQQRKAWFDNFDAAGLGRRDDAGRPGSVDVAQTDRSLVALLMGLSVKDSPSLQDWKAKVARRSLVNTYVWTSDGGLYLEEQQFVANREESTGGSYTMNAAIGIYTELTVNIGPTFGLDAMFGSTIMTQAMKSQRQTLQSNMDVAVTGERYVGKIDLSEYGDYLYTDVPSPGKVKGYRFMSFYLAPSKRNYDDFIDVIDEDWLNSTGPYLGQYNPDALALRTALQNPNEVWRVLHRVTYVSRVPPTQNNEGESMAANVRRPDDLSIAANAALIAELAAPPGALNPLAWVSENADRLLADLELNPVWGADLARAATEVKSDLMTYMRSVYGIPASP